MNDCENPDILECPGDSSCKKWGKCGFSKQAIREEYGSMRKYNEERTKNENGRRIGRKQGA